MWRPRRSVSGGAGEIVQAGDAANFDRDAVTLKWQSHRIFQVLVPASACSGLLVRGVVRFLPDISSLPDRRRFGMIALVAQWHNPDGDFPDQRTPHVASTCQTKEDCSRIGLPSACSIRRVLFRPDSPV